MNGSAATAQNLTPREAALGFVMDAIEGANVGDPGAIAYLRSERFDAWCDVLGWDSRRMRAVVERRAAEWIEHAEDMARARAFVAGLVRDHGLEATVRELYEAHGMTDREIASLIGGTHGWVARIRSRAGVEGLTRGSVVKRMNAARAA